MNITMHDPNETALNRFIEQFSTIREMRTIDCSSHTVKMLVNLCSDRPFRCEKFDLMCAAYGVM